MKIILTLMLLTILNHGGQKYDEIKEVLATKSLNDCHKILSQKKLSWFPVKTLDEINSLIDADSQKEERLKFELAKELLSKFRAETDYEDNYIGLSEGRGLMSTLDKWSSLLKKTGGTSNELIAFSCDYHIIHLQIHLYLNGILSISDMDYPKGKRIDWRKFLIDKAKTKSELDYFQSLEGNENLLELVEGYENLTNEKVNFTNVKTSDLMTHYNPVIEIIQRASIDLITSEILYGIEAYEKGGGNLTELANITKEKFNQITNSWSGSYPFFARKYLSYNDVKDTIESVTSKFNRSKLNLSLKFQ